MAVQVRNGKSRVNARVNSSVKTRGKNSANKNQAQARHWQVVPFDLRTESPITLKEAVKAIPSPRTDTGAIALVTIRRWIKFGLVGPDGKSVQLQGIRLGRSLVTSRESVQRFADRLSGVPDGRSPD